MGQPRPGPVVLPRGPVRLAPDRAEFTPAPLHGLVSRPSRRRRKRGSHRDLGPGTEDEGGASGLSEWTPACEWLTAVKPQDHRRHGLARSRRPIPYVRGRSPHLVSECPSSSVDACGTLMIFRYFASRSTDLSFLGSQDVNLSPRGVGPERWNFPPFSGATLMFARGRVVRLKT